MTQELIPPERFATFGQLLRHVRKRARLTLRELSIATGYSEGHLANLERDARRPDLAMVRARLLPALDLDAASAWATRLLDLATLASQPAQDRAVLSLPSSPSLPQPAPLGAPATDLLATKLFAPQPRTNSVPRLRLLMQLDRALTVPLTLVAAPAGAGKTTLLADWLATRAAGRGLRTESVASLLSPQTSTRSPLAAWLSLEAEDNDQATFVRYLVAACQQLAPHVGAAVLPLLSQAQQLTPAALLRPLLNDLAALASPSVIILDDCHVLTAPEVHATLLFFLEHLPPQLHLVIASREDPPLPLARMRARGALVELRAQDLRFTAAESTAFLSTTMALNLAPEHVAALESRTEGWAAGLQLAALALHERADHADMIAELSGTSRYLVDYLGDEVVDRLPAHLRTFVLQTSILDRMCGALCDAVLGAQNDERPPTNGEGDNAFVLRPSSMVGDSYSQHILRELERRHLFVVPLDNGRRWYRYHHLFADVVQSKMRAAATVSQLTTLYRRAADWHEQQGMLREALRYALAAGATAHAVRIIEQYAVTMIEQSAYGELRRWLEQLPEPVIWSRPRLCLAQSIVLVLVSPGRVAPFLDRAAQLMQLPAQTVDEGRPLEAAANSTDWLDDVPRVISVVRGILARRAREYPHAIALLEQAIAEGKPAGAFLSAMALLQLGIVYMVQGAGRMAAARFRALLDTPVPDAAFGSLAIEATARLGELLIASGQLHEAATLYEQTIAQYAAHEPPPILSLIHIGLSEVYYEWNDLKRTSEYLHHGITLGERLASIEGLVRGYTGRARILLARGDQAGAQATARKAQDLLEALGSTTWSQLRLPLGKLLLKLGDVTAATMWSQRRGIGLENARAADTEHEQMIFARLLLTRHDWNAIHDLTNRLLMNAEAEERIDSCIDVLILQSLALVAQGQGTTARAAVTRALQLAAPGGYIRRFIDEGALMAELLRDLAVQGLPELYLETLRAAFPNTIAATSLAEARQPTATGVQTLTEPLSERELEVLRMVADGHGNRAIAVALTIEVGTVKRHIHSLLGKLDAPSRTAAVARARTLGLL
jgi:LuxR family maltose regulon positive regulatory protein